MENPRILVAGGGITGLALAHALRERGQRAQVVEREARPGGKLRSERRDGFLCEWGPQSFSAFAPESAALLGRLGLAPRLVRPLEPAARVRCVLAGGRLHPVPAGGRGLMRSELLSLPGKLRLLGDLLKPRGPAARGTLESVAAFARRRLGPQAAERLLYPLVSSLYAGDPETVAVNLAFPALAALERDHRSLLWAMARNPSILSSPVATFPDGMEELPGALARALGDALRASTRLVALRPEGTSFRATLEAGGVHSELRADVVVLALPAPAAAPLVAGFDAPLAAQLEAIPYAPIAVVHLGWPLDAVGTPPAAYGFFVPPSEPGPVSGAVFTSTVFPGRAPAGTLLVAVRFGGSRAAPLLALSDPELAHRAAASLAPLLDARSPPAFHRVIRHPLGLPQYTLAHRERLTAIAEGEGRHPGLFFAGNAYRGLGVADCIREAERLADRIAAFLG